MGYGARMLWDTAAAQGEAQADSYDVGLASGELP